jgi:hypothetical protein
MPVSAAACTFAACFAALYAAHMVADHWVQTNAQATTKGAPGWPGRRACAAHVASYTLTALVALLALVWRTGLVLHPASVACGLTVSAVTHYVIDRRTPLRRLAMAMGVPADWFDHGGGAYALDQSWHIGWLFISALVMA